MSPAESITIHRVANGYTATFGPAGASPQVFVFPTASELFMWLESRLEPPPVDQTRPSEIAA